MTILTRSSITRGLRKTMMLGAAGAFAALLAPASSVSAMDSVSVATSSTGFLYLPAYVADELGYFEENDLDVTFEVIGSGSRALAAMTSGATQFYLGPVSSAATARDAGLDVIVVGAINDQYDANVAVSRAWAESHGLTEDSSFEDRLKALKDIRVAITSPGSGTDQLVRYLAKTAGLDPQRDMTIVPIASNAMIAAFVQDQIDGFTLSSPTTNLAVRAHDGFMLFHTAAGEVPDLRGYIYSAVTTTDAWASENPEVVQRMLKSLQMGLDALHDPALAESAREPVRAKYYSGIEPDVFAELWEATRQTYPQSVRATPEQIVQAAAFANEFSTKVSDETANSLLDNSYVDQALAGN